MSVPTAPVLLQHIASLLVYQSVLQDEVGQSFQTLLQLIQAEDTTATNSAACLQAYGNWFHALAGHGQSWPEYLLNRVLTDSNPFTQQAQRWPLSELPSALVAAARHDLVALQALYQCHGGLMAQWVMAATNPPQPLVVWSHQPDRGNTNPLHWELQSAPSWAAALEAFAAHYRQQGTGLVAEYRALRWQDGQLVGIAYPDPVRVAELVGYEAQKEALRQNTEFLLRGYPALHVLLYGSRGSGKSSLVKGLLHDYSDRGLRLVEVAKSELNQLPLIVEQLRKWPQKFIIFVDDLSFEEEEDRFKALKVVLEGNLTARPQNLVVYATSNRRHLIREFFGDRPRPSDGDEVHAWDTVQEKLSFSDRFGLTLTFEPANQTTYLHMVHHLARQAGVALPTDDLEFRALQWATRHNGRSGRTARQFVDFLRSELALQDG